MTGVLFSTVQKFDRTMWASTGVTHSYSNLYALVETDLNIGINASSQFRLKATYKKMGGLLQFYSNIFDKGFIQLQWWIEPVGLLWVQECGDA